MSLQTNDEFDDPLGQLDSYTALKGGFEVRLTSADTIVAQSTPTHDTTLLLPMMANRHIDIRSFIQADPNRNRQQSDLDTLHQMENAFHQSISVDVAPTSGTWKLFWEDTDGSVLVSADIPYNATHTQLTTIIEAFVPQIIASMAFNPGIPGVTVTGDAFPYIITLADENPPPNVREIGSWAPRFGIYTGAGYSSIDYGTHAIPTLLHSGTPCVLTVTDLITDNAWLQSGGISTDLTQSQIETIAGSVQEGWTGVTLSGIASFTVARTPTYYNWRAGTITFDGTNVDSKLVSRTPLAPVDLRALNADRTDTLISLVMPEWTSFSGHLDPASCTMEFTSDPNGNFNDEGGVGGSNVIEFNSNMTGNQFSVVLSAFGDQPDWSRITAVRIHISDGSNPHPSFGQKLTLMALRALDDSATTWVPLALDINTRTGYLESPVTLTGVKTDAAPVSPVIRSIAETGTVSTASAPNTGSDPSFTDGTLSLKFNSGAPQQVGGAEPTNHLMMYLRQRANDDGSWDWIQAQLSWGNVTISGSPTTVTFLGVVHVSRDSSNVDTYTGQQVITIPNFTNDTDYLFSASVSDDTITLEVDTFDIFGNNVPFYVSDPLVNTNYARVRGRDGWWASFDSDKDIDVDYFRSSNVSFATLLTAIFYSRTPIDGAQLAVEGSDPSQLWSSWELINPPSVPAEVTDDQLSTDYVKHLSAFSYKFVGGGVNTYTGIQSNLIDFDDWSQTFLDFDFWAPAALASHNSVQDLTIEGTPNTGSFQLSHDGVDTAPIAWNATTAAVQTALASLGNIGVGNVICTGGPLPSMVTIKFTGGLANADMSTLQVVDAVSVNGTVLVNQSGVRPQVFFQTPTADIGDYSSAVGPFDIPFIPGTWSHVHLDLAFLAERAVNPYMIQILTVNPTVQVWNIDNFLCGRRSVAWELRAIENGIWTEFKDTVNDPKGALHLPPTLRGTAIQLQARALLDDAWISSYTLTPHYAELGRLLPGPARNVDADFASLRAVPSGPDVYTV